MTDPDWKATLRARFEQALDSLEEPPESHSNVSDELDNVPDIYTFYETLAALRHEVRQGNRKTADAFSQFGDSLGAFDSELKRLREQGSGANNVSDSAKALRLPLVEMADRIHRLRDSFKNVPSKKGSWFAQRAIELWRKAWGEREQAAQLLVDQAASILSAAGLTPIPALGQAFDPARMTAVARDEAASPTESLVVVEEITRGYFYKDELVRLAEVRVGTGSISN